MSALIPTPRENAIAFFGREPEWPRVRMYYPAAELARATDELQGLIQKAREGPRRLHAASARYRADRSRARHAPGDRRRHARPTEARAGRRHHAINHRSQVMNDDADGAPGAPTNPETIARAVSSATRYSVNLVGRAANVDFVEAICLLTLVLFETVDQIDPDDGRALISAIAENCLHTGPHEPSRLRMAAATERLQAAYNAQLASLTAQGGRLS